LNAIIITGAGTGIGAAAAKLIAARGKPIVLVGRRKEKLDEVSAEIVAGKGTCSVVQANLADPQAPAKIVEAAVNAYGGIAGLVNNAATIKVLPLAEYTVQQIDEHLFTNIRAPFLLTQTAIPHLIEAKGSVVNISSSSGTLVRPGQSLYGMTKSALEYLTRSFAGEFARQNVRFNAIAYGPVDTPIHQTWATDLEAAYKWLNSQVPLGRIASATEAARWIDLLISDEAAWVTGAVIPVDGGQVLDIG
jgi:NAD(P)-dependent dehydrogenase (short-subunit alcohol dehydrogenase family)